jgi:type IV fimbrial biogenesis protein FimT
MAVNQVSKPQISAAEPASCKLHSISYGLMRPTCARRFSRGLTLLELIIVMGIVGILTAIAVPSYRYITGSNRVTAEVNGLVGDLQFARSEAIKEGQSVVVCAANTAGTQCLTSGVAWAGGWIVFADLNNNHQLDTTNETVLRAQSAFGGSDTFNANSAIYWIAFNREGFATASTALAAGSMITLHTNPLSNSATRCLSITQVGLLSVQTYNGGTCT